MAKIMALNGLIHGKYESESQMAEAMGWHKQRLNRITNGNKEPDLFEVKALADTLGVPFMSVADIFLQWKSPNGDERR